MADGDQMDGADGADGVEATAPAAKGKLKLMIAAIGVLVVIGGGAGAWLLFSRGHGEESTSRWRRCRSRRCSWTCRTCW